jgi:antitoxin component YwqK of YwqJK toxin-antitoxin module
MTRNQHLEFCKRCKNREFDTQQGLICGLTKRIADFETSCPNYQLDDSVKIDITPAEPAPAYTVLSDLSTELKTRMRAQQDMSYAVVGGLSASLVGALLWAVITVATGYQIGYIAIVVGLLVGLAVRYFGAGIDYVYGLIGGLFALFGCALGNILSQVGFYANQEGLSYFDVLGMLNLSVILNIFGESFSPMDLVFYGIAGYEGYKFAFRTIPEEFIKNPPAGALPPMAFAHLRLPIVVVLFVSLFVGYYFLRSSAVGEKTFYYESGKMRSKGEINYGSENGYWQYWWENGKQQQEGYFAEGRQDSLWKFYNEEGSLYRSGAFKKGMQHGKWVDYYPNGKISGEVMYRWGRQQGPWSGYYENGTTSQKGFYKADLSDGSWEFFYPNGQLSHSGQFKNGEQTGRWILLTDKGTKRAELEHVGEAFPKIINAWDNTGVNSVKSGNGAYTDYYENGVVSEVGNVRQGYRDGVWRKYSTSGKLLEEGDYRNNIYYLKTYLDSLGSPIIENGNGNFESDPDPLNPFQLKGDYREGQREGEWHQYFNSGLLQLTMQYEQGDLNGPTESFFESGITSMEGTYRKNKRDGVWKWYYEDGTMETTVTYRNGLKIGDQPFYDASGILIRTEIYKEGELVDVRVEIE